MGLDLDVLLVVGADYDEVIVKRTEFTNVTRYNPETGVPYQVSKEKDFYIVGNQVFTDKYDAESAVEDAGLGIYDELIGIELDRNKGERIASGLGNPVTIFEIESGIQDVSKLLSNIGICGLDINMMTYSSVSC